MSTRAHALRPLPPSMAPSPPTGTQRRSGPLCAGESQKESGVGARVHGYTRTVRMKTLTAIPPCVDYRCDGESYGMQEGLSYMMAADEIAVAHNSAADQYEKAVAAAGAAATAAAAAAAVVAAAEDEFPFADAPSSFLKSHPLSGSHAASNYSSHYSSANPTPKVSPRAMLCTFGGEQGDDWTCPVAGCGHSNFARRFECNRCRTPKAAAYSTSVTATAASAAADDVVPLEPSHAPLLPPQPARSPLRSRPAEVPQPPTLVAVASSNDLEGTRPTLANVSDLLEIKSRPALPRPLGMKALDLTQVSRFPLPLTLYPWCVDR
jgi:hypothetical protein